MKRNDDPCTVESCHWDSYALGLCRVHYNRLKRHGDVQAHIPVKSRPKRYRDFLPDHFYSDVSLADPWKLLGCVIVCEKCKDQLGPVWDERAAAMAIHFHQLRAHNPVGRHIDD